MYEYCYILYTTYIISQNLLKYSFLLPKSTNRLDTSRQLPKYSGLLVLISYFLILYSSNLMDNSDILAMAIAMVDDLFEMKWCDKINFTGYIGLIHLYEQGSQANRLLEKDDIPYLGRFSFIQDILCSEKRSKLRHCPRILGKPSPVKRTGTTDQTCCEGMSFAQDKPYLKHKPDFPTTTHMLVHIAMMIFSCNSINILSGINGLEILQVILLILSILGKSTYQLIKQYETFKYIWNHIINDNLKLLLFLISSIPLFIKNFYPAKVFIGNSYLIFSGYMIFVHGIRKIGFSTKLLNKFPNVTNKWANKLPEKSSVINKTNLLEFIRDNPTIKDNLFIWENRNKIETSTMTDKTTNNLTERQAPIVPDTEFRTEGDINMERVCSTSPEPIQYKNIFSPQPYVNPYLTFLMLHGLQSFNLLLSLPQLMGIVPCPRHRMPNINQEGLVCASRYDITGHSYKKTALLHNMSVLKNIFSSRRTVGLNYTFLNFLLLITGPISERLLYFLMMGIQISYLLVILLIVCPIIES